MILEQGHLYHIFNQGNNRQLIFYRPENYHFFLKKIGSYILPFADILAWCLMPNHFHLMVFVRIETHRVTSSHPVSKTQSFNQSIAVLLRSYTRAINKQENINCSLFREGTNAECLSKSDGITPSFFNSRVGTIINVPVPEKEYPQVCFNYIHNNPVNAGLVKNPEDWEFSSYRDHCGLRNGKLINPERTKELGLKIST
jgi:putative transposase